MSGRMGEGKCCGCHRKRSSRPAAAHSARRRWWTSVGLATHTTQLVAMETVRQAEPPPSLLPSLPSSYVFRHVRIGGGGGRGDEPLPPDSPDRQVRQQSAGQLIVPSRNPRPFPSLTKAESPSRECRHRR